MEIEEIKNIVKEHYNLDIISMEKIKNVYKISANSMNYCLKVIKYDLGHFIFIISAIKHLQKNNFKSTPEIISDKYGKAYIEVGSYLAYLTDWIEARECNYDNPIDIYTAVTKLAELHLSSEGFLITNEMKPRIGWFKWPQTFITRSDEILDFKEKIGNKDKKTDFDEMYLEIMDEELERAELAVIDLENSDYFFQMDSEIQKRGFCHHDFAHHNVLISREKEVNIIDFDYCILDSHLHDLASIIIRKMKNGKWGMANAAYILDCYNSVYKIENSDLPIIASFIEFPQEYWQLGIQYYWEKQTWGEKYFNTKLMKIKEDREDRQIFVNELMSYKYRRGNNG
ncbi:MAG: CotS family spore coat protein [Clostridiaceae bacterium]|nr:CotS family spore coat protein [Clostridiaceae bacterium]